ncbi:helix-turn-helix domain-containing protein [Cellulomonas sp. Root137]|uniref:helix-turn-helix domain-containing protein n=1 Tax=Cellulomonas sp. Root137 TaxID=1736459 RepID=UPI0009EBE4E3|nr:helix-turn-helix domain-containing protein [Cellulomonas sp. Root137]
MSAPVTERVLVSSELLDHRQSSSPEQHVVEVSVQHDSRVLLSVVEAAQRLGVGRSTMYELLGSGQIESVHIGRLRKVPVSALSAFVENLREHSSGGDDSEATLRLA